MHATATDESKAEVVAGVGAVLVGLGMLTFALFPLAFPIVVLLTVSALPLVVVAIVGAFVGAIVVGAGLGVRAVVRMSRRAWSGRARAGAHDRSVSSPSEPVAWR